MTTRNKFWWRAAMACGAAVAVGCTSWPLQPGRPPSIRQHADLRPVTLGDLLIEESVHDVQFDAGQSVFHEDDRDALNRAAPALSRSVRNHGDLIIVIEGHADDGGSRKVNRELGQRRADAVREILVGAGIPAERLRTESIGNREPQCRLADDGCHEKNRRVHLRGARFTRERG